MMMEEGGWVREHISVQVIIVISVIFKTLLLLKSLINQDCIGAGKTKHLERGGGGVMSKNVKSRGF